MISIRLLCQLFRALLPCLALMSISPAHAHEEREPREVRESEQGRHGNEERVERDESNHGSEHEDSDRDDDDSHRGSDHSGRDRRHEDHGDRAARLAQRAARIEIERDVRGEERVRNELLVIGTAAEVETVRTAGFDVIEQTRLAALDTTMARVRVPTSRPADITLRELQRLVPDASVAPHHIFRPSGVEAVSGNSRADVAAQPARAALVGVIDTGMAPATPALRDALLATRGFAIGGYLPREHGTAVGAVAARAGASLLSADVFGLDSDDDLAATTVAIARALDWLIGDGARVLNISIEGPDNPVLARVIRRALQADVAIVAAAGNGGPSAPPAYPAAYPGVIAVTAVDERGRVYRRANRGTYVSFAALGVRVATPATGGGTRVQSGTSFAAPLVAAVLAQRFASDPGEPVIRAVQAVTIAARDLGAPGRDEVFGWGQVLTPQLLTNRDDAAKISP